VVKDNLLIVNRMCIQHVPPRFVVENLFLDRKIFLYFKEINLLSILVQD